MRTAAISNPNVSLVDGLILRNEAIELAVSQTTGSIQSLRTHRDRNTRVSQRLVFHRRRAGYKPRHPSRDGGPLPLETQMVADNVDTTHDRATMAEITAVGRLLDREGQLLARFTQAVRLIRGVAAAIVDIQLDPVRLPEGDGWNCYFASRLAWSDEGAALRRGVGWLARETSGERIVSPEWVEIVGGEDNIVCLVLGLPFHRLASPTWLDTLLITPGSDQRQFQFALALDCAYPMQTALGIHTAANAPLATISAENVNQRGWFLHVGAKNLVMTHLSALGGERGIRCRLLETEGRSVATSLTAFRNFKSARRTDFLGNIVEVLSVVGGEVQFDISPHQWIQLEAEW
jgi:alpha-mannosidase